MSNGTFQELIGEEVQVSSLEMLGFSRGLLLGWKIGPTREYWVRPVWEDGFDVGGPGHFDTFDPSRLVHRQALEVEYSGGPTVRIVGVYPCRWYWNAGLNCWRGAVMEDPEDFDEDELTLEVLEMFAGSRAVGLAVEEVATLQVVAS